MVPRREVTVDISWYCDPLDDRVTILFAAYKGRLFRVAVPRDTERIQFAIEAMTSHVRRLQAAELRQAYNH